MPNKANSLRTISKMGLRIALILSLYLALVSLTFADSSKYECVYTVYVRTGSIIKGGTDSNISIKVYDENGNGIGITNLEAWGGLMGNNYNYFERGNLDIFSGRGPCLDSPICALNLTSDGSGPHHGWYCNYVEITTTGPHKGCQQKQFTIEQWLALDTSPYQLTATRNYCSYDIEKKSPKVRSANLPTLSLTSAM